MISTYIRLIVYLKDDLNQKAKSLIFFNCNHAPTIIGNNYSKKQKKNAVFSMINSTNRLIAFFDTYIKRYNKYCNIILLRLSLFLFRRKIWRATAFFTPFNFGLFLLSMHYHAHVWYFIIKLWHMKGVCVLSFTNQYEMNQIKLYILFAIITLH